MAHPPGPSIGLSEVVLNKPRIRDNLKFLLDTSREYGELVRFTVPGVRTAYLLNHPDLVRRVLVDNAGNYTKSREYRTLSIALENGLLLSEGGYWRRQRRLIQPAFHRPKLEKFADQMTGSTVEMMERWRASSSPARGTVDIGEEMVGLTLRIITKALFGAEIDADTVRRVDTYATFLNAYLDERMGSLVRLPLRVPSRQNRRCRRILEELDEMLYKIIDERSRKGYGGSDDILSMLMSARDEETGEGMSRKELRDEVVTLLVAGHETTAHALCWTWHLLSASPEVERRLHEELDEALGGCTPRFEDLEKLSYTRMVVKESLRLYPPAWGFTRQALTDDELGGFTVPAGSLLIVSPYVMHRNPAFWDDPATFDPDRFAQADSASRPRFAYFPYGGGSRQCVGQAYANMVMCFVVATVAQHYRLRAGTGPDIEPDRVVLTLRPKERLRLGLESRA